MRPSRRASSSSAAPELDVAVDGSCLKPGEPVTVGIRPGLTSSGRIERLQRIACNVDMVERLGTTTLYTHLCDEFNGIAGAVDMVAAAPGDSHVVSGDRIELGLPAQAMHLFDAEGNALPRTVDLPA